MSERGKGQLPAAKVDFRTEWTREGDGWLGTATLENKSQTPALMLRLNLVGARSGEQILPVFYEDNWISLLPGESKRITVHCADADTRGEQPEQSAPVAEAPGEEAGQRLGLKLFRSDAEPWGDDDPVENAARQQSGRDPDRIPSGGTLPRHQAFLPFP